MREKDHLMINFSQLDENEVLKNPCFRTLTKIVRLSVLVFKKIKKRFGLRFLFKKRFRFFMSKNSRFRGSVRESPEKSTPWSVFVVSGLKLFTFYYLLVQYICRCTEIWWDLLRLLFRASLRSTPNIVLVLYTTK